MKKNIKQIIVQAVATRVEEQNDLVFEIRTKIQFYKAEIERDENAPIVSPYIDFYKRQLVNWEAQLNPTMDRLAEAMEALAAAQSL